MAEHANPSPGATAKETGRRSIFSGGFRLGSLFGVRIEVDWSLLIIFVLIAFNLGAGVFPYWHPDWGPLLNWGLALGASVLFFASILAHELSHALVARAQGIPVRRITLFLFGGLAHMEEEPSSPKAEFLMAVVGPIASIAIGVGATATGSYLASDALALAGATEDPEEIQAALRQVGPVATLLLWLGPINLLLGIFNIIPGFPLDGGRIFRSIVWAITNDLTKATKWASAGGQLFAWTLMIIGATYVFRGGIGQGIWLLLIGWFLNTAARTSYQQLLIHQALEDVPVARVMRTQLARVSPELPLDTFVRDHIMVSDQHAFPVESDGDLVGLVTFDDVRRVPQQEWGVERVGAVMTPREHLSTLPMDADAEDALRELTRRDVEQIPILEGHHVLGLVRRGDLLKWLTLQKNQERVRRYGAGSPE